jgi:hypothetical protein
MTNLGTRAEKAHTKRLPRGTFENRCTKMQRNMSYPARHVRLDSPFVRKKSYLQLRPLVFENVLGLMLCICQCQKEKAF